MKTLIMTVMVTIFAATVSFDVTLGQTEPDQKASGYHLTEESGKSF